MLFDYEIDMKKKAENVKIGKNRCLKPEKHEHDDGGLNDDEILGIDLLK